jgi:hypothetical protein
MADLYARPAMSYAEMEGLGPADRWDLLRRLLRPLAGWLVRETRERSPEPLESGPVVPDPTPRPAARDSVS